MIEVRDGKIRDTRAENLAHARHFRRQAKNISIPIKTTKFMNL